MVKLVGTLEYNYNYDAKNPGVSVGDVPEIQAHITPPNDWIDSPR